MSTKRNSDLGMRKKKESVFDRLLRVYDACCNSRRGSTNAREEWRDAFVGKVAVPGFLIIDPHLAYDVEFSDFIGHPVQRLKTVMILSPALIALDEA